MTVSDARQANILKAIKTITRRKDGFADAGSIALEMPALDGAASYDPRGIAQTLRPMRAAGVVDYDAESKTYSIPE